MLLISMPDVFKVSSTFAIEQWRERFPRLGCFRCTNGEAIGPNSASWRKPQNTGARVDSIKLPFGVADDMRRFSSRPGAALIAPFAMSRIHHCPWLLLHHYPNPQLPQLSF